MSPRRRAKQFMTCPFERYCAEYATAGLPSSAPMALFRGVILDYGATVLVVKW